MPTKGTGRLFPGVMVSSSFVDLRQHREALIEAIDSADMKAIAMEHDSAKADVDVIDSSMQMVDDCVAYCAVIGHRYGQTPTCPDRNPAGFSLTHLELLRARQLGRPILLFIMGDDHPLTVRDVEADPTRRAKLKRFREDAKRMSADGAVERVYAVFQSYEDFRVLAQRAVADLARRLTDPGADDAPAAPAARQAALALPPELRAVPRYAGSHDFVGRSAELAVLDQWVQHAEPNPILLVEAIGGTGKSMLTWRWTTHDATRARPDWAGRLWYSFYERGAEMTDFLRHALTYMTGRPDVEITRMGRADLADAVIDELEARPWLMVLDGVERLLVAYHRLDAAQLPDEHAERSATEARDVRTAISVADDEILRRLVAAGPSKLLLTTRIVPRSLVNRSGQTIPGVRHVRLSGLQPEDAEALLRSCGVRGTSERIQAFLTVHCDCHPLVIGVLAGLVHQYLPNRGDFDAWADDQEHGGRLKIGRLDLIQKRNHILETAITDLGAPSRDLLSSLALLSDAADLDLLRALNPHAAGPEAERRLGEAIIDLEQRGLVQFDHAEQTYDLHPVVRGVAFTLLGDHQIESLGQRVVDHFSVAQHPPYEHATSLNDLRVALNLFRANMHIGRYDTAITVFERDLSAPLRGHVPSHPTIIALLQPLFPDGWRGRRLGRSSAERRNAVRDLATALVATGREQEGLAITETLVAEAMAHGPHATIHALGALQYLLQVCGHLAHATAILDLMDQIGPSSEKVILRRRFSLACAVSDHEEVDRSYERVLAQATWEKTEVMLLRGDSLLERGALEGHHLQAIEESLRATRHRVAEPWLETLRAEWHLAAGRLAHARQAIERALALARRVGDAAPAQQAMLAYLLVVEDPSIGGEAIERLAPSGRLEESYWVARAWQSLGRDDLARQPALTTLERAWADGEPFVFRFALDRARALLDELGEPIPELAAYDPAAHPPYPWEAKIRKRRRF